MNEKQNHSFRNLDIKEILIEINNFIIFLSDFFSNQFIFIIFLSDIKQVLVLQTYA
jgi:hypothetical protein